MRTEVDSEFTGKFGLTVEIAMLLFVTVAASVGAGYQYWMASSSASSSYDGAIDVRLPVDSDETLPGPQRLDVEIGFDGIVRDSVDQLAAQNFLQVRIHSGSSSLAGREIVITLYGDTVITDARASTYTHAESAASAPIARSNTFDARSVNARQEIALRLPRGVFYPVDVVVSGEMRRPLGVVRGGLADVKFPACFADSSVRSCSVDGGDIEAGETLSYAWPRLAETSRLSWKFTPGDGIKLDLPGAHIRLGDNHSSRQRDGALFSSGALLGLAGAALLELLIRLVKVVEFVTGKRRGEIRRRTLKGVATWYEPTQDSQPEIISPVPDANPEIGQKWNEWKRLNADRRVGR
ncbi:hypothetical protein KOI35_12555 [Actinoplanes bogorensis]|uniref:Uncharacterized protein n=1 Tax=Paractinoplanes bogorensis TaxID=1610840 RepID=A0ABS5YMP6_9ACTN|nr:hypothetical protein [Actinoplanes bogorensis]MBU2664326.1 hypothetical protein [Actinoplanes bogorensis]